MFSNLLIKFVKRTLCLFNALSYLKIWSKASKSFCNFSYFSGKLSFRSDNNNGIIFFDKSIEEIPAFNLISCSGNWGFICLISCSFLFLFFICSVELNISFMKSSTFCFFNSSSLWVSFLINGTFFSFSFSLYHFFLFYFFFFELNKFYKLIHWEKK